MALLFGRRGPQSHKTLQVGRELLSDRRVLRFHKMPLVDKELQFGRQVPRFHMKLQVDMELLSDRKVPLSRKRLLVYMELQSGMWVPHICLLFCMKILQQHIWMSLSCTGPHIRLKKLKKTMKNMRMKQMQMQMKLVLSQHVQQMFSHFHSCCPQLSLSGLVSPAIAVAMLPFQLPQGAGFSYTLVSHGNRGCTGHVTCTETCSCWGCLNQV